MTYYLTRPSRTRRRLNWQQLYNAQINQDARVSIPVDVYETEEIYKISAQIPGLQVDDLEIEIEGDLVTMKGELQESEENDGRYLMRERAAGTFTRKLRLPVELNAEKSEAELKNGLLMLTIPKAESALPRKIQVNKK